MTLIPTTDTGTDTRFVPDPCWQATALLEECHGDLRQAYVMSGFNLMITPADRPDLFELWWRVREILELASRMEAQDVN